MIELRPWRPDDAFVLRDMISDCLTETYAAGADFPPTPENVEKFLQLGMAWSQAGEPTLIGCEAAQEGWTPWPFGYVLWGPAPNGFHTRYKMCAGGGTYVKPSFRKLGRSTLLRARAAEIAKARGYDCIDGATYDERGLRAVLAAGFQEQARHVRLML